MSDLGVIGEVTPTGKKEIRSFLDWRIPGLLSLDGKRGDFYDSPFFTACDRVWFLRIFPKGIGPYRLSDWVSLFLIRCDGGQPLTFHVTLGIRGPEGAENQRGRSQEYSGDYDGCCWYQFCSRSKLREQKSRLMPGDALVIALDMKRDIATVHNDSSTQTDEESKEADIPTKENQCSEKQEAEVSQSMLKIGEDNEATLKEQGMEELKESLQRLFASVEEGDVLLKVQGKEFRAHKVILQMRSPVFGVMFAHDMVEKQSGVVTVEDCDPESFPDLLEHVYTGSIEGISAENVFHLYSAADKYDLRTLKKACADFLKQNLSVTSFCNTITLAVRHDDKKLIERATEFFCNNTLDIITQVEWPNFTAENPITSNELHIKQLKR